MMKIEMAVPNRLKTRNDAAGILKWDPRCRFMVKAWSIVRLLKIPIAVPNKIPVDQSGIILSRLLRSATSSMIHSLHDLAYEPSDCLSLSVFSAARFKKLHPRMCA